MSEHQDDLQDLCSPAEAEPSEDVTDASGPAPLPPGPVEDLPDASQFPVPDFQDRVEYPSFRQSLMVPRYLYYKSPSELNQIRVGPEDKLILPFNYAFSNETLGRTNLTAQDVDTFRYAIGKIYNSSLSFQHYLYNKNRPSLLRLGHPSGARAYTFPDYHEEAGDRAMSFGTYSFDISTIVDSISPRTEYIREYLENNDYIQERQRLIDSGYKVTKINIIWNRSDLEAYGIWKENTDLLLESESGVTELKRMETEIGKVAPLGPTRQDTTFRAPAAFYTPESLGIPEGIQLSDTAMIKTYTRDALGGVDIFTTIDAKEVDQKESLYRRYADEYLPESLGKTCAQDDVNQKFGAEAVRLISQVNNASQVPEGEEPSGFSASARPLLDTYAEITFNMHGVDEEEDPNRPSRSFAQKLEDLEMDSFFLGFLDAQGPSDEEFYTQILDQIYANPQESPWDFFENDTDAENERVQLNARPRAYSDFLESIYQILVNPAAEFTLMDWAMDITNFPLGRNQSDLPGESFRLPFMIKLMGDLPGNIGLTTFLNNYMQSQGKVQSFLTMLKNQPSYSEVVAYRVEKKSKDTGEIIQNFYFLNTPGVTEFKFIDTQAFKGKDYIYSIYTINLVLGLEYEYLPSEIQSNTQEVFTVTGPRNRFINQEEKTHSLGVYVAHKTIAKIIEAPYHQQDVTVQDLPPLPPEVELMRAEESRLLVAFSRGSFGEVLDEPVLILPEDLEIINRMKMDQTIPGNIPREIRYKSDSIPTHYQIFALRQQPRSYADFSQATFVEISSDFPTKVLDFMQSNTDYYLTFRARDLAGISNPTSVYKCRVVEDGNGIHIEIDPYYFTETEEEDFYYTAQAISVEPAPNQTAINIDLSDSYDHSSMQSKFETSRGLDGVSLGHVAPEDSIWGRKFALDIVSTTTGRKVTIILDYTLNRVVTQDWEMQTSAQRLEQDECSVKYSFRRDKRSDDIQRSDSTATPIPDGEATNVDRGSTGYDRNEYSDPSDY